MLTLLLILSLQAPPPGDWPAYGRDPGGGARFSPLTQITRANVGAAASRVDVSHRHARHVEHVAPAPALEVTPIVVDGRCM